MKKILKTGGGGRCIPRLAKMSIAPKIFKLAADVIGRIILIYLVRFVF